MTARTRTRIRHRSRSAAVLRMDPVVLAELAHRLTSRDRQVLELVWEHRVLTTGQLTSIVFGSLDRAQHRLLELFRLGALDRFRPWRPVGTEPWHWVLGPAGAHVLAGHRGITVKELGYRRTAALNIAHSAALGHQVGVNEFFARLHAHARHLGDGTGLVTWWPERRCATLWGDLARPDAYGRWSQPHPGQDGGDGDDAVVDFFLEYDTGTEPLGRVVDKLAGYAALAEATRISTPVLLWVPSGAREANLRALLGEPEVPVATAVHTPATDLEGPAGPVWLPAEDTGPRLRLAELGDRWPISPHTGRNV